MTKTYQICINLLSKFFFMSVPFSGPKNNFAYIFTFSQIPLSSWMHRWHCSSFNVLRNTIHGHSPATIITLFTERSAKLLWCFFNPNSIIIHLQLFFAFSGEEELKSYVWSNLTFVQILCWSVLMRSINLKFISLLLTCVSLMRSFHMIEDNSFLNQSDTQ